MSRPAFRRLARIGVMGLPWWGLACSQIPAARVGPPGPMQTLPASPVDPAMNISPALSAAPARETGSVRMSHAPAAVDPAQPPVLPIGLDAVLRLAEEQNPQIGVARSKVSAACGDKLAAAAHWLPDIHMGVGYYRHEGGIQLQEGPLIESSTGAMLAGPTLDAEYNPRDYAFRQLDAARKVWQNQGELSKVTYEQLIDASTTYVDLLAAHAALAISLQLENNLAGIHEKAVKAFDMSKSAEYEIEKTRIEGELTLQHQNQHKLRGQIEAASAKLAYALGLDPYTQIVPMDHQMVAFQIVDVNQPVEALVGQALASGPGVRELEGILAVIQAGMETGQGPARFAPTVRVQMAEGVFGAGQGGTMNWANRFDLGVQARWNITDVFNAKYKRASAVAQMNQVQLSYQELRAKLTVGVQEARSTILALNSEFADSEDLIRKAQVVVEKTTLRIENTQPGASFSDVLQAHKARSMAQLNYVDMLREYDKAQLRLLVLTGAGPAGCTTR